MAQKQNERELEMPVAIPKIKQTTNYAMFVPSEENRLVNLKRHKKLKESMKKYGFLPYWAIVVRSGTFGVFTFYY